MMLVMFRSLVLNVCLLVYTLHLITHTGYIVFCSVWIPQDMDWLWITQTIFLVLLAFTCGNHAGPVATQLLLQLHPRNHCGMYVVYQGSFFVEFNLCLKMVSLPIHLIVLGTLDQRVLFELLFCLSETLTQNYPNKVGHTALAIRR